MRRSRRRHEELAVTERPQAPIDETTTGHGLADEALRLQDLIGNANTTAAIARSPLQRDTAGTEAAPAKEDEKEAPKGAVYTITMADIGTFELLSWSWGVTNSGGTGGGGGGPGKHEMKDLMASKYADEHSAKLMQYAATGQHIPEVELRTTKGSAVFVIKLKDVLVSSFQTGGGSAGDEKPVETMGLTFASVEFEHSEEQGEKGK